MTGYDRPNLQCTGESGDRFQVGSRPALDKEGNGSLADDEVSRPCGLGLRLVDYGIACRVPWTEMVDIDVSAAKIQPDVIFKLHVG